MYPHRIRLRGPWECEPLIGSQPLPPPCHMTMPCRWNDGPLQGFHGVVRFRRKFGYPGRIDSYDRVWLTFAGVSDRAEVALNGEPLGKQDQAETPFEYEVTELLGPRNELSIMVEGGINGGLWGEVALEVRCTAYLRHLRCEITDCENGAAQVHVFGEVAGNVAAMLELYAVLDRSTMAYETVRPMDEPTPFHLQSEPLALAMGEHRLRVDLVNTATVWYTWEQDLTFTPMPRRRQ